MFLFTSLHFPVASLITVYSCAPYLLSGLSEGNRGVIGVKVVLEPRGKVDSVGF